MLMTAKLSPKLSPGAVHVLTRFSRVAAASSVTIAAAALFGWAFDIRFLVTVGDNFATLKANTAVCFILAASALWLTTAPVSEGHSSRRISALFAWAVVVIAATTLSQYLLGWNAGIDELLVRDRLQSDAGPPGRMSPASTVTFILVGSALPLLNSKTERSIAIAQILATLTTLVSALVLFGYLFSVRELYSLPPFSAEALRTALAFLLLGLGLLAARPDRGWVVEFIRDTPSAKMGRNLLVVATVGLLLIDWLLQRGEDAGWYGPHFGLSLSIVVDTVVLGAFIWFTTRVANDADEKILRLTRVHAVISGINSAIIRAQNRDELFQETCRVAVAAGEFPLAWIGVVDHDAMRIVPVAYSGAASRLADLERIAPAIAPPSLQNDPLMRALRQKKATTINDISRDRSVADKRWYLDRGIRAAAILPLVVADRMEGVLALYAGPAEFFDDEEMRLLLELGADVAFGLDHLNKQERLDYLAFYDAMTGLANAKLFRERVALHIGAADGQARRVAVVVIDIERFKTVNETLGRHVGDDLLRQIASRLREYLRDPTRLGRLGPDQFALIVPDVRGENDLARGHEQLLSECFGQPFHVDGTVLRISARGGIALYPNDGADADRLLENAETALKRAKLSGERYLFYTQQMSERSAERLSLETKLHQAMERDEFVLYYQPKIDLKTNAVTGVEALIRWRSPDLGLVPPARFIPLLEETGLILDVGRWALRRAAADHRDWSTPGKITPRIAVNVSAIQLRRPDFVADVQQAIREGISPPQIDIEITETLIMENIAQNIERLQAVRALGLEIAIDDFGTGYSSLAYLAKLPVQFIKIDRSFIVTMLVESNTLTVVSTIVSMAHTLGLKVVAEGVDSYRQVEILRRLGCDQLQGFVVTEPLSATEMRDFLERDLRRMES